jgi:hypothetical protein
MTFILNKITQANSLNILAVENGISSITVGMKVIRQHAVNLLVQVVT